MEQIIDLYNKSHSLLEKAYECYKRNQITDGDKFREKANSLIEQANHEYKLEHTDRNKLYGFNRNFGVCFHILENSITKILGSKNGKQFINEVIKLIKSDKVLKEQFDIYNNICNKQNIQDAENYVNCIIECIDNCGITKSTIKESNEKLIDLIESNCLIDKFLPIDENQMNLYDDIEYLMTNKLNVNNIEQYNSAKKTLVGHLNKNISVNKECNYNENVDSLVNKYNDINIDEAKLIEQIVSKDSDKLKLFEEYKTETLSKIDETIKSSNEEDKEQWNNIKKTISETIFSKNSFVDDITKFIDIQNSL